MGVFYRIKCGVVLRGRELRGRSPLSRSRAAAIAQRSDACVTSYWVLPDAGIGRTGSKAAFLPSSALGENDGKCLSTASRGDRHFPLEGHWKERGKIAIE